MTPFPNIALINEKLTGRINEEAIGAIYEAAIGAIIALRNPPSCFFISCFTVSVAPSSNRPDFYSGSRFLMIFSISSFEMNIVDLFPALTAPCPLFFFLSNLFITDEIYLLANLGKTFTAKERERSNSVFYAKLHVTVSVLPRNLSDLII